MTYLAIYLYLIGAWALSECTFEDDQGNTPSEAYKALFCFGWPVLVPIWILRNRIDGE